MGMYLKIDLLIITFFPKVKSYLPYGPYEDIEIVV